MTFLSLLFLHNYPIMTIGTYSHERKTNSVLTVAFRSVKGTPRKAFQLSKVLVRFVSLALLLAYIHA